MKKIFVTVLSFFYLLSGIGISSVQHFCQNNQEMMSASEQQCCPAEATSESSVTCHSSKKPDVNSCSGITDNHFSGMNSETKYPDECCKIQHKYNQLDHSSLPLPIDLSQVIQTSDELNYYPQYRQNINPFTIVRLTDPSILLNIPLLI